MERNLKQSIIILAISLFLSATLIANSIKSIPDHDIHTNNISNAILTLADNIENSNQHQSNKYENTNYFYKTELAEYLGIDYVVLNELITKEEFDIPYVKLDHQYIFYKVAVDQWLINKRISFTLDE